MVKRRIGIFLVLACFCLYLVPFYVQAISTSDAKTPVSVDERCSLTISYGFEGIPFSDLPVSLYKIADVSEDLQYTFVDSFADSKLIINGIKTQGEWNVIRSTLETYIVANSVEADYSATTDQSGKVSFDALNTGLYLAINQPITQDGFRYSFDSALFALPNLDTEGNWQYRVEATAKTQAIPPADDDIEYKVLKLWKGDLGSPDRPQSIEIEIFRNEISHETVTLSNENNWTYSWKAEDDGAQWKVIERNVPAGYIMTVEERETAFVLTNTLEDEPDDPIPSTGDTSNVLIYVILMIISGFILVFIGKTGKRTDL